VSAHDRICSNTEPYLCQHRAVQRIGGSLMRLPPLGLQTVGDLRRFLAVCRTELPRDCRLATAFPPAALEDDSTTLQDAGLANAVIVQKNA
jgi:hypothetical protein